MLPTPPVTVVDYPVRVMEAGEDADIVPVTESEATQANPIPFSNTVDADTEPKCAPKRGRPRKLLLGPSEPKRGRGRPRKLKPAAPQPKTGKPKQVHPVKRKGVEDLASPPKRAAATMSNIELDSKPNLKRDSPTESKNADSPPVKKPRVHISPPGVSAQLEQFLDLINSSLHGNSPRFILGQLSPHSVVDICDLVGSDVAVYDYFVQHLNALPPVYASEHGHLALDESVLRLCHPIFFQTFKPVQTTGDGSCLYHALSLTLTKCVQTCCICWLYML